jgi:hypothetical protein
MEKHRVLFAANSCPLLTHGEKRGVDLGALEKRRFWTFKDLHVCMSMRIVCVCVCLTDRLGWMGGKA